MSRFGFLAVVAGLVTATPSLAADASADVTAAYAAWDAAFNQADAKAVAAAYTDDAKLLPPTHKVLTGHGDVEAFFGSLFQAGVHGHRLELIEAGGGGDMMWGTANWSAQGKGADGSPQAVGGIATHIFERQADGSLKVKLHTFN